MAAATAKGQVRVRGTCKEGHVTEARSDPGRVTWEGVCSTEGCEHRVKARRVPRERPEVTAPATPAPSGDGTPKLKKVDYASQPPKPRGTAKPAGDAGAGDQAQPAPGPAADLQATDQPGSAGGPAADPPGAAAVSSDGSGPTKRGLRGRLRRDQPRSKATFRLPWESE